MGAPENGAMARRLHENFSGGTDSPSGITDHISRRRVGATLWAGNGCRARPGRRAGSCCRGWPRSGGGSSSSCSCCCRRGRSGGCWRWCCTTGRCLNRNRHGRARLKVTDCRIGILWRLIGVEPEVIQCAPADRIRVLILRKRFAIPCYGTINLGDSPWGAAVTLVIGRAVICPTGFLGRSVEADVTNIDARRQRDTERLNGTIKVHVVDSILVVPHAR
jgi:hypothetical protein